MPKGAPRPRARVWPYFARGALRAACLWLAVAGVAPAQADILDAYYDIPTEAYGHGVLPGGEYAAVGFRLSGGREIGMGTYQNVYEDTAPRLVDLDGDGSVEVITVISYFDAGAAVRIFDEIPAPEHPKGSTVAVIAETPPIGTRHRWLGMIGAQDLDGDGKVEIAYVDRPHLARTLRIWRFADGALTEVASLDGVTNHRIGEPDIAGGIRTCAGRPEMIVASADWSRLIAVAWDGAVFAQTVLGRDTSRDAFARAMVCAGG